MSGHQLHFVVVIHTLLGYDVDSLPISPQFLLVEFHHDLEHSFGHLVTVVLQDFIEEGLDLPVGWLVLLDTQQSLDVIGQMCCHHSPEDLVLDSEEFSHADDILEGGNHVFIPEENKTHDDLFP